MSSSPYAHRSTQIARVEDPCYEIKRVGDFPTSRVAGSEAQPTPYFHAKLTKLDSIPTLMVTSKS